MQPETPVWMSFKIVFLDISDRNKSQAEVNVKSPSNSIFYSLTTTSVLQSLSFSSWPHSTSTKILQNRSFFMRRLFHYLLCSVWSLVSLFFCTLLKWNNLFWKSHRNETNISIYWAFSKVKWRIGNYFLKYL